jgi:hypothetical protein
MSGTRPLRTVYEHGPDWNGATADPDPQPHAEPVDPVAPAAPPVAPRRGELGEVIDDFMEAAEEGEVADGFGQYYTPEALRELHSALTHVKSELGTMHVEAVRRWHVQGMLDELRRAGLAPGRLTAVMESLHAVYSYAIERGLVDDTPVIWLTSPQQGEPTAAERSDVTARPAAAPRPASTSARRRERPRHEAPPASTPTPTRAMVALGGRVLFWTMRATVTLFVLIAIVLVVEFA